MWKQHVAEETIGLVEGKSGFNPARPTLLMVHGSGGSTAHYQPQLRELDDYFNVAAIDLPGHGQTPDQGMDRVEAMADWLGDFIGRGPIRPVLMGHSLGGAVALSVALARPYLLKGLVLFGTGSRLKVLPAILEGISANFLPTVRLIVKFAYHDDADPSFIEAGVAEMSQCDPQVLLNDFSACDNFDVTAELGKIHMPTLVVVGDGDKLTPPKYGRALAEAIPGARLEIIDKGGHMANLENWRRMNQVLAEFMSTR